MQAVTPSAPGPPPLTAKRVLFWSVLGIAGLTFAWFHGPGHAVLPMRCVFHSLTGWHCPGCGATRAVHHALHGNFLLAFHCNPLFWLVTPVLLWSGAWSLGLKVPRPPQLGPKTILALAFLMIAYTVLRNLPWYPFTLLAPP